VSDDGYQEQIIDHYQNPRNFGKLEKADVSVRESNASCGDLIELSVKLQSSKVTKQQSKENSETQSSKVAESQKIVDVKFKAVGCAISVASASMLLEKVKDEQMSLEEVGEITIGDMKELLGVELTPTRAKCALLVVRGLRKVGEVGNE